MKLVTFTVPTVTGPAIRIGAIIGDQIIDLNIACRVHLSSSDDVARASQIADALVPPDMIAFFTGGKLSKKAAEEALTYVTENSITRGPSNETVVHALETTQLLAPVPRPTSIRDTLSFEGHMINFERRTGKKTPQRWYETPIYYKGNPASVVGHAADVVWPDYTEKFDYELEFGCYIGKQGCNITAEAATDHIAGYTIFNDMSARDVIPGEVAMFLGPGKGKDMDSGNVMGPCLVTPDELDVSNLDMKARINGEIWSHSNSNDMFWSFEQIIAYISRFETLYPGDFIGSGTVENGCGDEMERWIKPGDIVELEVEGIGKLTNKIVKASNS
ncbi:MAG: fumarylacetoacetate hydrolase family protein [Gammaproteobacteria bacterium]|nr:fumarylacetoacetate hydrolase family protein [Gammaproteobacteria bacterium]